MAPHSSTLAWKSHGWRSLVGCSPWGHKESDTTERLSDFTFHFHALEKEMATHSSVLPGESQGLGSLVGCCLWGRTESDTTEVTAATAEPEQSRFCTNSRRRQDSRPQRTGYYQRS